MKKLISVAFLVILSTAALPQQSFIEQSLVINIEVPVRVFQGSTFVDGLTIKDFELFEEGVPQKIDAVYLVKKRSIERSDERKRFRPETQRNFFLFFEISEYTPKMGEALDYFMKNVVLPGDKLYVVTPLKSYRLKEDSLEAKSSEDIAEEIKGLLRKDALSGNSEYRSALRDLAGLAKSLAVSLETGDLGGMGGGADPKQVDSFTDDYPLMELDEKLILYTSLLDKLEILRQVDELRLLDFAKFLDNLPGQKYVYLFHQEEFIPQVEPRLLDQFMDEYQDRPDIIQTVTNIFTLYKRDISFDVNRIKQAYADSSVAIHFLYITRPPENVFSIQMEEHSEDIYGAFREIVQATGGYFESSGNPSASFQRALESSENYYLVYYTPKDYAGDGTFKEIEVRVRDKDYRVLHRAGYFSD